MNHKCLVALLLLWTSMTASGRESSTFDSDGVRLRYVAGGEGPLVVLLHGFGGSAEGLYVDPGTFDALVSAGFRVVALDQRGHGESDKPYAPDAYGPAMVGDVRRLLDHLGAERAHLVGYSMGGKVANSFRDVYPDRLMSVTLGGYGWPWRSPQTTYENARARLDTRPVLPGNDLDALAAVSVGMHALHASEDSLRANEVPVLAIIGDRDEVVSRTDFDELAATMANVTTVIIPGTHAGPDGAPYKAVFAEELIGFLERL